MSAFDRFEAKPDRPGVYVYRIKNTGGSSARFGPCEVCGKPCSEVFYQVEGLTFSDAVTQLGVTYMGCRSLFGHKECLRKARR